LEQESGLFFNMKYFEDMVLAGDFKAAESYISSFTKLEDNSYSTKIYFELRKHKYLEALDRKDSSEAFHICFDELKVFSSYDERVFSELTLLLMLDDFREHEELATYGNPRDARSVLVTDLRGLIENNQVLKDKLTLPPCETPPLANPSE
ncbi:hypothetical protein KI387_005493, partial [Taxus chinensis]